MNAGAPDPSPARHQIPLLDEWPQAMTVTSLAHAVESFLQARPCTGALNAVIIPSGETGQNCWAGLSP